MSRESKNTYTHSEEFRRNFGNRLRETRKKRGYNIEQTHKALGIPRSTYSGWELGKRVPLNKSFDNLATFLETSVSYLMLKTDDPSPEKKSDLNEVLEIKSVEWKGKPLSEHQATTIAALIEAYLENEQK
jgi:transcriptional regulator with XRE-family HTH domain